MAVAKLNMPVVDLLDHLFTAAAAQDKALITTQILHQKVQQPPAVAVALVTLIENVQFHTVVLVFV